MFIRILDAIYNMKQAERQEQKLSQEEFAKWIEKGITVCAEIEDIEDVKIPYPAKITGISCDGFIMTDASGKEYVLFFPLPEIQIQDKGKRSEKTPGEIGKGTQENCSDGTGRTYRRVFFNA